jgi:hypothetical protein
MTETMRVSRIKAKTQSRYCGKSLLERNKKKNIKNNFLQVVEYQNVDKIRMTRWIKNGREN